MRDRWDEIWDLLTGMRKFLLMLIVFVIAVVFRVKDLIDGAQVVQLLENITLAYVAGNSVEYVAGTVKTHYESKEPRPAVENTAEQAKNQELEGLEKESENG